MRVLVAGTAIALMLAACTLLTPLDGFSGGPYDAEGGADGSAEAAVDGTVRDAGSDAAGPLVIDAGPFCAQIDGGFCDDFERALVLGQWDGTSTSTGGSIAIVGGALSVDIPGGSATGTKAELRKAFPNATHVVYAFDLTLTKLPSKGSVQINNLFVEFGNDEAYVSLVADSNGFHAAEQIFPDGGTGTFYTHDLSKVPAIGAKARFVYDIHLATTPTVVITMNGEVVYDNDLSSFFQPGSIEAVAGVDYTQATFDGLAFTMDNVTLATN